MKRFILSGSVFYTAQCLLCLAMAALFYPDKYAFVAVIGAIVDAWLAGANYASDWHDRHG